MEHAEALEALELAAVEPGGFDRLMAGDTPEAALLAGHLAACSSCRLELERLRRSAPLLREAVRSMPSPDLRDRTLAYVRALGRDRTAASAAPATIVPAVPEPAVPVPVVPEPAVPVPAVPVAEGFAGPAAAGAGQSPVRRAHLALVPRPAAWLASLAAVAIVAVGLTLAVARPDAALQQQRAATAGLADLSRATARLLAAPDVRSMPLVDASSVPHGLLLVSPSSGWIVMQSDALTPPATGQEYRCWIESGGSRRTIGRMEFADGLAYWAGWADGLSGLRQGDRFGVTLVGSGPSSPTNQPALSASF